MTRICKTYGLYNKERPHKMSVRLSQKASDAIAYYLYYYAETGKCLYGAWKTNASDIVNKILENQYDAIEKAIKEGKTKQYIPWKK